MDYKLHKNIIKYKEPAVAAQFDTIKFHILNTPAVKKLENIGDFSDMAKYSYWKSIDSYFPLYDLRALRHPTVIYSLKHSGNRVYHVLNIQEREILSTDFICAFPTIVRLITDYFPEQH
jgi:hypothetical protein